MVKLFEDVVVVGRSDPLRKADRHLDVRLQGALQHLVHLAVVVIVVPDAHEALDVVPDGRAEPRRVHVLLAAQRVVRQLVHEPELVVQQVAHVAVQPADERVGVVVPRVVLNAESGDLVHFSATGKILVVM